MPAIENVFTLPELFVKKICPTFIIAVKKRSLKPNRTFQLLQLLLSYLSLSIIFVPAIENEKKICIRVCFSFCSTQNQVPQRIVGLS